MERLQLLRRCRRRPCPPARQTADSRLRNGKPVAVVEVAVVTSEVAAAVVVRALHQVAAVVDRVAAGRRLLRATVAHAGADQPFRLVTAGRAADLPSDAGRMATASVALDPVVIETMAARRGPSGVLAMVLSAVPAAASIAIRSAGAAGATPGGRGSRSTFTTAITTVIASG